MENRTDLGYLLKWIFTSDPDLDNFEPSCVRRQLGITNSWINHINQLFVV